MEPICYFIRIVVDLYSEFANIEVRPASNFLEACGSDVEFMCHFTYHVYFCQSLYFSVIVFRRKTILDARRNADQAQRHSNRQISLCDGHLAYYQ